MNAEHDATSSCTVHHLIVEHAARVADAPAVLAAGRAPLSYGKLLQLIDATAAALHAAGIGVADRVAVVLPDGPELAAAVLGISAAAVCVPLNPGYRASEFEVYLADLHARALVVTAGTDSPAVAIARKLGLEILELMPDFHIAGNFDIQPKSHARQSPVSPHPSPLDTALALYTSGTAARPKLAPLSHANIVAAAQSMHRVLELTARDRCLNVMPLFHIHGLSTVFSSLVGGGSVVCMAGFSAGAFFEGLQRFRPTWYTAAPAVHRILLDAAGNNPPSPLTPLPPGERGRGEGFSLRFVRSASSGLSETLRVELERAFGVPVLEAYGMTETAPQIASNRLSPDKRKPGSVGQPAGTEVAIFDEMGNRLPTGETGEVVVRGPNVMAGYANDAAANRTAFCRGWFRTGDVGHVDADGFLFITGRLMDIINRGGEKVSPREIDEALLRHPAVADAATFPVPHPSLGQNVAAAVVLKRGIANNQQVHGEIRQFLAERLCDFKMPQPLLIVDAIPKSATGKLRRAELATHLLAAPSGQERNEEALAHDVANIMAGVLGLPQIGVDDNFFHLGGHSLTAQQVVVRLLREFQVELPLRVLFEQPTAAELAEVLLRERATGCCAANEILARRASEGIGYPSLACASGWCSIGRAAISDRSFPQASSVSPLTPLPRGEETTDDFQQHPLTPAQRRLWFLDRIEPGNPAYHMAAPLHLIGALEVGILERCLTEVVRRQQSLRTTFRTVASEPVQVIAASRSFRLPVIDLQGVPPAERFAEALRLAEDEPPFHLGRGPLFRAVLVRLNPTEHILLLTMHHIVSDGWSIAILHRELAALYTAFSQGRSSPLPELPMQLVDIAARQRAVVVDGQLAWWREKLHRCPPLLDLPTDRPRSATPGHQGAQHDVVLPRQLVEDLAALSRTESATLFMTLLAALQTLLQRYSGQNDIVVGTPIANRTGVETESIIGFFANTLALRGDLSGNPTFRQMLQRTKAVALGAFANQDVPFDRLVEELQLDRDSRHTPLFQVMFAFQNIPGSAGDPLQLGSGLMAAPLSIERGAAKFDLTLYVTEGRARQGLGSSAFPAGASERGGLAVTWQYRTELFDAATIARMAENFLTLLRGIVANPQQRLSELSLLSDAERRELLKTIVPSPLTLPSPPGGEGRVRVAHQRFEMRALRTPDALAASAGDRRLTYGELHARANQLACHLRQLGAKRVGVGLTRSVDIVVALLGVLKAGCVFIPLDPGDPRDRVQFLFEDAKIDVLLTESALRQTILFDVANQFGARAICLDEDWRISQEPDGPLSPPDGAALAYVIYTSGSTGRPKGVMITHHNLAHYVDALGSELKITPADRWLHTAAFSFSSSMRQLLLPLSHGACVVMADTSALRDPAALFELIRRENVTVLDIVPSYWRQCTERLLRLEDDPRRVLLDNRLRLLLSASEPLPADVVRDWRRQAHPACLMNMFGQTETTGIVSLQKIGSCGTDAVVPIGKPLPGIRMHVLDERQQLAPIGVPGEICIGGATVGAGYLNQPELSAERFIPDPFCSEAGAMLYRTGDLGRWRADGTLEHCGRIDQQIKVRGHRVDPGEIETLLHQHPEVRECAVLPRGTQLIAFVAGKEQPIEAAALGSFLHQKLPAYMLPATFTMVAALPRTTSGKVDRQALVESAALTLPSPPGGEGRVRGQPATKTAASSPGVPCFRGPSGGVEPGPGGEGPRKHATPESMPGGDAETLLAEIWAEVLGVAKVGRTDNFFELGGNSMLAIQMVDRAHDAGLRVPPARVFQHQTIAALLGNESDRRREGAMSRGASRRGYLRVSIDTLRAFGREALERAGLCAEGAAIVTEVQLEASLRGQPTHNIAAIPRYAQRIAAGNINAQPDIRSERETAVSALIDGDNGPGQWVGVVAMELAIRKARTHGVGVVGVRRSNHYGAAGHYVWLVARENLIGLSTTNAPASLAPTGGVTPTFGNNPLAVAVPTSGDPIVLDIAMSVAARGKIGLHLANGKPLPAGWILDRFGQPSTNPADLASALGVPIGGHKGYGLALIMEVLAGVLTGAGFCWDHRRDLMHNETPPDFGHFFLAIDPQLFMPLNDFTTRVDRMIDQVKRGDRAGDAEVFLPGEMEMRARTQNLGAGIPMEAAAYQALIDFGQRMGLRSLIGTRAA